MRIFYLIHFCMYVFIQILTDTTHALGTELGSKVAMLSETEFFYNGDRIIKEKKLKLFL